MDYNFGDILDAKDAPFSLGHFIIILGETKNNEVMYYIVTSRVYAVFKDLIVFFDDCISRKDKNFLKYFKKERKKPHIIPHGNLMDALFLDKCNCYGLCFDVDSMIVLKSDPFLIDKDALETLRKSKKVYHKSRLSDTDIHKLISMVRYSPNFSIDSANQIEDSFNKIIKK